MKHKWIYLMALAYIGAGINHFLQPAFYLRIMPPWVPYHEAMVYFSGVCEIVFGAMLIPLRTRPAAGWLLIAMLIAIYPANIYMAVDFYRNNSQHLWIAIVRLPLQLLFIYWAWLCTRPRYQK